MKTIRAIVIAVLFLTGCSPSQEQILKAIFETQTANPITKTISPSVTPTISVTPSPIPTLTPTPDIRIIEGQPKDFILQRLDLPEAGGYFLRAKRLIGRISNEEVIGSWGREIGTKYLNKTGRVDGWFVNYERGLTQPNLPKYVYCRVENFQTSAGALTTLDDYNWAEWPPFNLEMTITSDQLDELENNYHSYEKIWMDDAGDLNIQYVVSAAYYNFFISCSGKGKKEDVPPEFVAHLVYIIKYRLRFAPLVTP